MCVYTGFETTILRQMSLEYSLRTDRRATATHSNPPDDNDYCAGRTRGDGKASYFAPLH
jgi:hypothetical protein